MKAHIPLLCLSMLVLTACSREPRTPEPLSKIPEVSSFAAGYERGARLFSEHCAQCHGPQAQGHPDWQTPNDGTFSAAPPLDALGPAPRRTKQQLVKTIKKGVRKDGVDIMPGYRKRLSDEDIAAIMAWFQALWPPEVLQGWQKTNGQPAPSF